MDLLDDFPDEPVTVVKAELVSGKGKALTKSERNIREVRKMEDELYRDNMEIMRDAGKFRDIDPRSDEIPPEWIEELGQKEASKRFRVAKAAWMSAKTAPVGISNARAIVSSIVKARATEKAAPTNLNVGVAVNMPMPTFKIVEVDE
ncbi:MAG: hypothetical protein NW202_13395 [Nitrospira sp.]|nr:hypothetical protein [Nitrospira sp.]